MIKLTTPISKEAAASLQVDDTVEISGYILCGRDAVLPKVLKMERLESWAWISMGR